MGEGEGEGLRQLSARKEKISEIGLGLARATQHPRPTCVTGTEADGAAPPSRRAPRTRLRERAEGRKNLLTFLLLQKKSFLYRPSQQNDILFFFKYIKKKKVISVFFLSFSSKSLGGEGEGGEGESKRATLGALFLKRSGFLYK